MQHECDIHPVKNADDYELISLLAFSYASSYIGLHDHEQSAA